MGAALDILRQAATTLEIEANGVSDNPLIFPETDEALSGGNFHAEPVAFAADMIAMAICEIGSIAERRIAMLVDPALSGLPAFLTPRPGLNSGFMIRVTAAALVSENKQRAYPASVDSIPTSANQEDHVSMAAHGARRLLDMAENATAVLGIELLAAAQGIDFHAPLASSTPLEAARATLRAIVPTLEDDRHFHPDMEAANGLIRSGALLTARAPPCRAWHERLADHPSRGGAARRRLSPCRQWPCRCGRYIRFALARPPRCRLVGRSGLRLCRRPWRDTGRHGHFALGHRLQPRSFGRLALSGAGDDRTVPDHDLDGEPLYAGAMPDAGQIACRRARWFDPYHAALEAEIARLRARHGRAVLYDAHSIRSHVPRLFEGELPQFNIGTNGGQTCAPDLRGDRRSLRPIGPQPRRRWPISRGWTTRHYGRPERGIHAVQMELAIRGYMDEPDEPTPPTGRPPMTGHARPR
jgi:hypothetical protein